MNNQHEYKPNDKTLRKTLQQQQHQKGENTDDFFNDQATSRTFHQNESQTNNNDDGAANESQGGTSTSSSAYGVRETEKLKRFRFFFSLFLITFAIALAFTVYSFIRKAEQEHFTASFEDDSNKIIDRVHSSIQRKLAALESLSFGITSYVNFHHKKQQNSNTASSSTGTNATNSSWWPFVTIPNFEYQAASVRELSRAVSIELCPIVTKENRQAWELYTQQHRDSWIQDGLDFEELESTGFFLVENQRERRRLQQQQQVEATNEGISSQSSSINNNNNENNFTSTTTATEMNGMSNNGENHVADEIMDKITYIRDDGERLPVPNDDDVEYFFPVWQSSPVSIDLINLDLNSNAFFANNLSKVLETKQAIVGNTMDINHDNYDDGNDQGTQQDQATPNPSTTTTSSTTVLDVFRQSFSTRNDIEFYNTSAGPVDFLYIPVFDVLNSAIREPVAVLTTVLYWESYMYQALQPHTPEIRVVIINGCNGHAFSYAIQGEYVEYIGVGDLHDPKFNDWMVYDVTFQFDDLQSSLDRYHGIPLSNGSCQYHMELYPTQEFQDKYLTYTPWIFFVFILAVFASLIGVIFIYDRRVEKNYQTVYQRARQAGAIVSSIFPAAVRQRLYQDEEDSKNKNHNDVGHYLRRDSNNPYNNPAISNAIHANKVKIKSFLTDTSMRTSHLGMNESTVEAMDNHNQEQPPESAVTNQARSGPSGDTAIVESFSDVTILFSDVVGFTAWSSQRDPGEVFTFLQTLYHEFDSAARAMGVFKVETIGDCYVAATGLPEPQADHAVRMAKFASECMLAVVEVTRNLEVRLGPDTGELTIRTGLHSGPVTGGVLKGSKARFQLFGDTMNMAARMESNSMPGHIQCSESTAQLIQNAGKGHWLKARDDLVSAKGKGDVQTYWLNPKLGDVSSNDEQHLAGFNPIQEFSFEGVDPEFATNAQLLFELGSPDNRYLRLIDWNVELLSDLLKQIAAKRLDMNLKTGKSPPHMNLREGSSALDEVTEMVALPQVAVSGDKMKKKRRTKPSEIDLGFEVISQLRDYVTTIASMYRPNAFHNFEHASHVTMSANKLLKRVTVIDADDNENDINPVNLHDYTYGITSDPLTQFTLIFCALIHDVDHAGVSNYQLIQENAIIAKLYKNKSIAEQNSVDLSWDLLMDPRYVDLRKAIYADEDELKRFRQLMVNIVLATDIFDKDLKSVRDRRWGRAFQYANEDDEAENPDKLPVKALDRNYDTPLSRIEGANLKATIVMEHLIQASDVAHTMQHWQVYLKWNERLFNEMYAAYKNGRAVKDPSTGWYEGEIMFFDKYVIPLAKKLDECRVFGVCSDEYLNYANQNRKQWAIRGDSIVEEFLKRFDEKMNVRESVHTG